MFGKAIGDAPLQVYISALLFSPAESITRKQFSAEAPHWVKVWPDSGTNWTSCIQKFDDQSGDRCDTMAISSCGTWLAAHYNSEIRIWDVEMGKIIRCIKLDSYRRISAFGWFKFSPQNKSELAILTYDGKLLLVCDIAADKTVRRIRLPDAKVYGISFLPSAPDIISLIMGDHHKNKYTAVYLNTQKEEQVQISPLSLNGTIKRVAFSPINGDILAISVDEWMESQIIIYNINTDDIIHSLAVYRVGGIAFTPDGKYLAAFTRLHTPDGIFHLPKLILLDIMTGNTVWASEIQHCSLEAPTFSADGQLLGVDTRGTVQIWDIASGQCIQESGVEANCHVFSPNENKLFCSSHGSISVIEVGHRGMAPPRNTEIHPQSVIVSPDGRKVASSLLNKRNKIWNAVYQIWDTDSGTRLFAIFIEGHNGNREPMFSPDSSKIALLSHTSLAVWDISSQKAKQIYFENSLTWTIPEFRKPIFSPNSQYLALENTSPVRNGDICFIKILDMEFRKCLLCLRTAPKFNSLIAFSSDSRQLAASLGFDDGDVRTVKVEIWDIASGSKTHAVTLSNDYVKNYISSKINACSCAVDTISLYFNASKFAFSDDNHLILGVEWHWYNGIPHDFNIKVILTINTNSDTENTQDDENLLAEEEPNCGVDALGFWITINKERVVWLPPEYRRTRLSDSWDARNGCIAITNTLIGLSIFKFFCSVCPGQMVAQSGEKRKHTSSTPETHKRPRTVNLDDECFIIRLNMSPLGGKNGDL